MALMLCVTQATLGFKRFIWSTANPGRTMSYEKSKVVDAVNSPEV